MQLQRFGGILSYISGKKKADMKAFAVPLANNMEAKHCAGQTLYLIFNEKSIWRAYLMSLNAKTKTLASPELHFKQDMFMLT